MSEKLSEIYGVSVYPVASASGGGTSTEVIRPSGPASGPKLAA